jgi:hypothetical protein
VVSGWAIDSAGGAVSAIGGIVVKVDGVTVGNAVYGFSRPDVCATYPGRPACPYVGYSYTLNTANLSNGAHAITASVTGSNGAPDISLATVNVTVSNLSPLVTVESPAQGAVVSGSVIVSGWAIDNASVPGTAISSVLIKVDGVTAGAATYGIARGDVCASYPGRPGCPNVGFSYALNTNTLPPGSHVITAVATDSDASPDTATSSPVTITVQSALAGTKFGVFRNGASFLEDSNGNGAYDAGIDRFIASFTGPGGFQTGDSPVVGDWTGDGKAKVGIYRPSLGQWYLDANNNGTFDAGDITYSFGGVTGDVPVMGDWMGIGKSCVGVFRSGFFWVLDLNCNGKFDGTDAGQDAAFPFGGISGDVPVVGAWAGGNTRVGVVRKYVLGGVPVGNPFYWVLDGVDAGASNLAANHQPDFSRCFPFGGLAGDTFVTGDWYNTGTSSAAVFRSGLWVLDPALPGAPTADHLKTPLTFTFGGAPTDVPVVGKW